MAEWPELCFSLLCHTTLDSPLEAPRTQRRAAFFGRVEVLQLARPTPRARGACWRQVPEQRLLVIYEVMRPIAPGNARQPPHAHLRHYQVGFHD